MRYPIVVVLALASVAGLRSTPAQTDVAQFDGRRLASTLRAVVKDARRSVVLLRGDAGRQGLGTIVGADGWILAKASDLDETTLCVLADGQVLRPRVVGVHEPYDLAMLRVEAKDLPAIALGPVDAYEPGRWAVSVGRGPDPIAWGVISVAPRRVPSRSGFLGVSIEDADPTGVWVRQVVPESAAADAGLRVDDRVVTAGGQPVRNREEFIELISGNEPGSELLLDVERAGRTTTLRAVLKRRTPVDPERNRSLGSELSRRRNGFPTAFQHDSVLAPEECGGPVLDIRGRVIGINIARAGRTQSFAIPIAAVLAVLADLESGALAPKERV